MTFMKSALAASAVTLSLGSTASAQTAADAADAFFDRYNEQNVPAMVDLFEPEGTVIYVPFALTGPVEEIGP